ncbi:uncharacterized protein N7484_011969 [Penicillium longicatenatum]|uniref:uncharacterized protein n=1 Tax=Penicillium longicatenatum TaxID=1561947 RepID=UPI002548BEAE|nr:uncharacterized protein N7484_011969 [Penicillium longicatenatum]KAJ5631869.1 hypothetical protein N7484_011969 [Penicillium longicatenatum]
MDDHPEHWSCTLMGWLFWKDAEAYQERMSNPVLDEELDLDLDLNLHKCFPFNLGPEEGPHAKEQGKVQNIDREKNPLEEPEVTPTSKRRRKLSMSDIKGVSGLRRNKTVTAATSRLRDLGHRVRSPSPTRPPHPFGSPRTLQLPSLKKKLPPRQTRIEKRVVPASPPRSVSRLHVSTSMPTSPCLSTTPLTTCVSSDAGVTEYDTEIATLENPLLKFRGGSNWSMIPRNRERLRLDLFWPYHFNRDDDVGPRTYDELKYLCEFWNLRSLKITGMMQSFQRCIWRAVWLNPELDELELEMVLEPEIVNRILQDKWKDIKEGWAIDESTGGGPVYFGNHGSGELHRDIGYGEYLDKNCIEVAKVLAMQMGRTSRRLSIRKLTLSGFVIDADPIIQWFDPKKLRYLHFKGRCIDAGLWLPLSMKGVSVQYPQESDLRAVPVGIVNIDLQKDLNAEVIGGKKIIETG